MGDWLNSWVNVIGFTGFYNRCFKNQGRNVDWPLLLFWFKRMGSLNSLLILPYIIYWIHWLSQSLS